MKRVAALLVAFVAVGTISARQASAQENIPGPGTGVLTIAPAGATFFTEGKDLKGPSFGNYDAGAEVTVNFNRYVGVAGAIRGALGVSQDLKFGGQTISTKSPDLLNYSGNLVVSAPNRSSVVPYVTGG